MYNPHHQIDFLYRRGVNICAGCKHQHAASCGEDRYDICQARLDEFKASYFTHVYPDK